MMPSPSIFSQIIDRKLPATIRYEDDEFIAFDDINPQAPVHVLVVPKRTEQTLEGVPITDEAFHARLLLVAREVAKTMGISANYKLIMNVGKAMQIVPHMHLHVCGGWTDPSPTK